MQITLLAMGHVGAAMVEFREIVSAPELLMGVKAVWGRAHHKEPVVCFSAPAGPISGQSYFSKVRVVAERAMKQPYLILIAAGREAPAEMDGRLLRLVKLSGAYGSTTAFVQHLEMGNRLERWPIAAIITEAHEFIDEPHLIDNLGYSDRALLRNAYDRVVGNDEGIKHLWTRVANYRLKPQEIELPPRFKLPSKPELYQTRYPQLTEEEGKRVWKLMRKIERSSKVAIEAKEANRAAHNGLIVCIACGLSDASSSLFDAHHLTPLAAGMRTSRVYDFVVLCPTCHRWAHLHKTVVDPFRPLPLVELRKLRLAK
jgi:5-methylcytosine-specific restriction protein A